MDDTTKNEATVEFIKEEINYPAIVVHCPNGNTKEIRVELFNVPGWGYQEFVHAILEVIITTSRGLSIPEQVLMMEFISQYNKLTMERINAKKEQGEEKQGAFTFQEPQGEA